MKDQASSNTEPSPGLPAPIAAQEQKQNGWLAAINPTNAARVIKGVGYIVGKATKYSNTLSQTARDNRSRDTIAAAVAERIAAGIRSADPNFERAFERDVERLTREQANLDDIADIVGEELGQKAEGDFKNGELDDDWLYQFEQAAKGFSSERMKHTFAKILSGQILRPGSFSPATLRTLTTLSAEDARLISVYMSMAYVPLGGLTPPQLLTGGRSPGTNGLGEFGLNYEAFSRLQQCGFLQSDLGTHRNFPEKLLVAIPASIGSKLCRFLLIKPADDGRQIKMYGPLPTVVGSEIAQVVDRTPPPSGYLEMLTEHFETKHFVKLVHS